MSGIALAMLIDNSSTAISTYGLTALEREMNTLPMHALLGYGKLYLLLAAT